MWGVFKKAPCVACSSHQPQCACGQKALPSTACSKCPQPLCDMAVGCQPRCAPCWTKMELKTLCEYCRCERPCLCGSRYTEVMCQPCYETHPSLTLPKHQ